jgi:hypothetical protein
MTVFGKEKMLRIRLPGKETEVAMTVLLGLVSLYCSFFGNTVTDTDRILLIIAAIVHFCFFREVIRDRVILYGWSIMSTL